MKNNLPTQDMNLRYRDNDLRQLHNFINDGVWRISVYGEAGIGKTSLVLEFAHQLYKLQSFDAVVWTSAKKYELTVVNSIKTGPYLRNEPQKSSRHRRDTWVDDVTDLYRRVFEFSDNPNWQFYTKGWKSPSLDDVVEWLRIRKILLVIDDLDSWADWGQFLNFAGKVPKNSTVIITSRRRFKSDKDEFPAHASLKLAPLDRMNSEDLLLELASERGIWLETEDKEELLDFSNGNPLLIKLTVALIAKKMTDMSFEKVKEKVKGIFDPSWVVNLSQEVKNKFSSEPAQRYIFNDLYNALPPSAQKVLLVIALMPRDSGLITTQRLYEIIDSIQPSNIDKYIEKLQSFAFIDRKPNDDALDIHDLVREYVLNLDIAETSAWRQVVEQKIDQGL